MTGARFASCLAVAVTVAVTMAVTVAAFSLARHALLRSFSSLLLADWSGVNNKLGHGKQKLGALRVES